MLIPPAYLKPSPGFPGVQGGSNSLKIRVECVEKGSIQSPPCAEWDTWGIDYWPRAVHVCPQETKRPSTKETEVAAPPSHVSVEHGTPSTKKRKAKGTTPGAPPLSMAHGSPSTKETKRTAPAAPPVLSPPVPVEHMTPSKKGTARSETTKSACSVRPKWVNKLIQIFCLTSQT
ncbi:hypothetical protein BDP27DRAFT_537861 [Rhodocollybia butyracea]|uniref:Uncharacterized protein n=1 Tax=Rhodocollybia butyracea TaxID=206335 RepID=A0A9P5P7T4_9AGAR|nr:hypothetical protein BDP27DRAFT_537861 [Rhodocollybia butyracea]